MIRLRPGLAAAVGLSYALAGAAWIGLSDRLAQALISDPARLAAFQIWKDGILLALAALALYVLLRASPQRKPGDAVTTQASQAPAIDRTPDRLPQVERELRESEERYRRLFEQEPTRRPADNRLSTSGMIFALHLACRRPR